MFRSLRTASFATGRIWRVSCCASLLLLASGTALTQNPDADPRFGSSNLRIGFDPDPFQVDLRGGGNMDVGHLGGECLGYVNSDQPDHVLNYLAGGATLGIFIASADDTTIVINDPMGNWHCNDDSEFLSDLNPGLALKKAPAGNYQIWVGSYDNSGADTAVKLVFTEQDANSWANMNIELGPDTSDLPLATDIATIEFGDDDGQFSNDNECDDPRFEGDGMATFLDEADENHDATDCRNLYSHGQIRLAGEWGTTSSPALRADGIEFGDNSSIYANDGECDDPRFNGPGAASSPDSEHTLHDAADCLDLYQSGRVQFGNASTQVVSADIDSINFGDDASAWSEDGECDDPRFTGSGVASYTDEGDRLHDATDCRRLYAEGSIQLLAEAAAVAVITVDTSGVYFGDDSSVWSEDDECDDPRFEGNGMAHSLNDSDLFRDASDCESLMGNGSIRLRDGASPDAPDSGPVNADVDANNNA